MPDGLTSGIASAFPSPLPLGNSALYLCLSLCVAPFLVHLPLAENTQRMATALDPLDRGGEAWSRSRESGMCVCERGGRHLWLCSQLMRQGMVDSRVSVSLLYLSFPFTAASVSLPSPHSCLPPFVCVFHVSDPLSPPLSFFF